MSGGWNFGNLGFKTQNKPGDDGVGIKRAGIVPVWSFDSQESKNLSWEHPWKCQGFLRELLEGLEKELE